MSSGACRALVALLLLLVALTGLTLPVAANSPNLDERSDVIYSVDPSTGDIDVEIQVALRAASRQVPAGVWGPIVVEDMTKPRLNSGFQVDRFEDLPGLWRAMYVSHNAIPEGESANLRIRYRLNASVDQAARRASTPARVDPSYVYACVPGQDTDGGEIRLSIPGEGGSFVLDQSGSIMEQDGGDGLTSGFVDLPNGLFTCVEGTREENLVTEQLLGPDGRTIVLQAWQEFPSWLSLAERNSDSALRSISAFLGLAIPGEGPIIIRQSPPRLVQDPPVPLGGYASDHDTRGIVQLDAQLQFHLGGQAGDVWVDDVHFQQGVTSLWRRDFQNGIVLVNPAFTPMTAPLGQSFRRISGVSDPATNDGAIVTQITVPPSDARFLIGDDQIAPAAINDLRPLPPGAPGIP
jgi:hypothetical protein